MSFKFQVKTLKQDGTKSTSRVMIATNDEDAQEQANVFVEFFANRDKPRQILEIVEIGEVKKTPRHIAFVQQYGTMPAYGDFEGTGWMDDNQIASSK